MNWQSAAFSVTQAVGFIITVVFGIEAVVKVGAGAWNSIREVFKQDEKKTN